MPTVDERLGRWAEIPVSAPPPLHELAARARRHRRIGRLRMAVIGTCGLSLMSLVVVLVSRGPSCVDVAAGGGRPSLAEGSWRLIPSAPIENRAWHSAVWTGSEMIVWGGQVRGLEFVADRAAYDPASDRWRMLAPAPLRRRSSHAAMWTGTEMIVWGGEGGSPLIGSDPLESFTDGAAYDPASDRWRMLAPAPLSAGAHSVVAWTGSEVLVWGGVTNVREGFGAVNEGAGYDPSTDRWRPLPKAPLSPRDRPLGTWTGREFVVWGGQTADQSRRGLKDGAAYDPSTDRWRKIASSPTPGTFGAVAIWTGTEMLVTGGGARLAYDPTADRWRKMSRGPQAASDPTLVWTGSHAIVWGGGLPPDGGYSSRGAVYDPETDRWVSLPEFDIPGRQFHAAVWTGSQMLLWGGFDSATRGDGAAYDVTPESRDPVPTSPATTKTGASP